MINENIFDSGLCRIFYPISLLYELIIRTRYLAYRKGLLIQKRLPGFVVSVGNISLGGTGKTPAVIEIAKWAKGKGYPVGVLSRGYKGFYKKWALVSDGKEIRVCAEQSGDEPYLMAKTLKGVPVAVSKDRYLAGINIAKRYGIDFFVLDDGFQHIKLKRDIDILLINGEKGFGNKKVVPSGPLREPIEYIKRADIFLITGEKKVPEEIPCKEIFFCRHLPKFFIYKNLSMPAYKLKGKRIVAFAGIAYPERFKNTLEQIGVELLFFKSFPDHYWYRHKDIEKLLRYAEKKRADFLVTTEKDRVRIDKRFDIGYIKISLEIENRDRFFEIIDERYQKYKNTYKSH